MDKEATENQTIMIEFGNVTVTIKVHYHPAGDGKAALTASGLGGKSKQFSQTSTSTVQLTAVNSKV